MKKFILICVLVIATIPAYLLLSGTISVTSFAMILNVMAGKGIETPSDDVIEDRIQVADGFGLSLYVSDLPNARFIAMTANRDLLVSRPHKGEVVMIRANRDDASVGGERVTLLEGLNKPSGIVVAEGWLLVGESDAIGRIAFDESTGTTSGSYERILEGLTGDGNHPYKQIKRGPDGKVY
jgi:glucose/arabinose dehydrogenase